MRLPITVLLALAVGGCVAAPSSLSARSAASVATASAPVTDVTYVLREDPPLPNSRGEGWSGLRAPTVEATHQHGHHAATSDPTDHGAMGHGTVPAPTSPSAPETSHAH